MPSVCVLLAEPSLRKRSDTYLPKYRRASKVLSARKEKRVGGQNVSFVPLAPLGFATEQHRSSVPFPVEEGNTSISSRRTT